jgi:hypothetical protein
MPQAESNNSWCDSARSLNTGSLRKASGGRPSNTASKLGTGEDQSDALATSDWQRHFREAVEGALVQNLDAIALAIVQPLQEELRQLVPLLPNQRTSASAAAAEAVASAAENASEHIPLNALGSRARQHHSVLLARSTENMPQQQQLQHQRQRHAGNVRERADEASQIGSQPESNIGGRRRKAVAAHRADPPAPRENYVAHSMLFAGEWPDSAAASRATAAAAAVRGGNVQKELLRLQTGLENTHPSKAKASDSEGQRRCGWGGTGCVKGIEVPSQRTSLLPTSLPNERRYTQLSLPSPMPAVSLQTTGASGCSALALRGMSCSAEIVMAGPTEQEGTAKPANSGHSQLIKRDVKKKLLQESPRGEDSPCNSTSCRTIIFVTKPMEQAESAITMQEGSQLSSRDSLAVTSHRLAAGSADLHPDSNKPLDEGKRVSSGSNGFKKQQPLAAAVSALDDAMLTVR